MKNTVIANRKKRDWPIIKKYFEDRGVDINGCGGIFFEQDGDTRFYYGIINGKFGNHYLKQAQQANTTILEVSDIDKEFKVGDVVVLVSNERNYNYGSNDLKIPIGILLEISGLEDSDTYQPYKWLFFKGYKDAVTSNQARHATPEEINQYKGVSDTVTLPKQFVLEAHKSACSDWKKRIEEVVPELFVKKKLKANIWYIEETTLSAGKRLVFANKITKNEIRGYGFDGFGNWEDDIWYNKIAGFEPATEQEVFEALKAEAVKRGFTKGVKVDGNGMEYFYGRGNSMKIKNKAFQFDFNCNALSAISNNNYYIRIFKDGTWAEIISTSIPKEIQSIIDKYGKEKLREYVK